VVSGKASRPQLSLKGRALKFLAQREHSRIELERKLGRFCDDANELERVLDALQRDGFLSDERFAQSLARRRSSKLGVRAVAYELGEHRLSAPLKAEVLADLKASEPARLRALWQRRFGTTPASPEDYARQSRFFLARGFEPSLIHRLLRQPGSEE
jgi:regulatory protein